MRYRRTVCFLLGVWTGVSAMLSFNAFQNFDTVDEILKAPPEQGSRIFNQLGPENSRALLRYMAGKENVNTFQTWEQIQFAIGFAATLLLFLGSTTRLFALVPAVMLLLVGFLHFWIWPEMAWLDHLFAFGNSGSGAQVQDHFWKLHGIYLTVEAAKDVLGLALAAFLCLQQTTRRRSRRLPGIDQVGTTRHGTASG